MAEARHHARGGVLFLTLAILAGCGNAPTATPGASAIGPVDLPAAGGTVNRTGSNSVVGLLNRSATGTFIATLPN